MGLGLRLGSRVEKPELPTGLCRSAALLSPVTFGDHVAPMYRLSGTPAGTACGVTIVCLVASQASPNRRGVRRRQGVGSVSKVLRHRLMP